MSRRSLLAASMSAVIGGAVLSTSTSASAEPAPPSSPGAVPENALVTLGVQADPPPVPNRTGISTTLKVGSDLYQIDCGLGSLNGFTNAGFKFDDLKSMFITHLHTDHMVDYWSFLPPPPKRCSRPSPIRTASSFMTWAPTTSRA
jgi:ribonuclease BN (tRNA processing enzyme)